MKRKQEIPTQKVKHLKVGIFDIEKFRQTMKAHFHGDIYEDGYPINFAMDETSASVCIWRDCDNKKVEEIKSMIKVHEENGDLFHKPSEVFFDNDTTFFVFNKGCYDFPLKLFIKDLQPQVSFGSLNKKRDSKHYLLTSVRILKSISTWLNELNNRNIKHPIFEKKCSTKEIMNKLLDHLWVENGCIKFDNYFTTSISLVSSPLFSFNDREILEGVHERLHRLECVIKEFSNFLLKPMHSANQRIISDDHPLVVFYNLFAMLSIHTPSYINEMKSWLTGFIHQCDSVIEWFSLHRHWPEITFNSPAIKLNAKSSVNVKSSDVELCKELDESFMICDKDVNNLVLIKPVAIAMDTGLNGITMRIFFDIPEGFYSLRSYVCSTSLHELRTQTIMNFSLVVRSYAEKLGQFFEEGNDLGNIDLIDKTYVIHNKSQSSINMMVHVFRDIVSSPKGLVFGEKPSEYQLQELTDVCKTEPNNEKKMMWKFGSMLAYIYGGLMDFDSTKEELVKVVNNFIFDTSQERLFLMPWVCDHYFIILSGYIFHRNPATRPTFTELALSPYMSFWIHSKDLSDRYREHLLMSVNVSHLNNEHSQFLNMTIEDNEYANSIPIRMDSSWKDFSEINCKFILDSFATGLIDIKNSQKLMKNRRQYDVKFTVENTFADPAQGDGVVQEAINMYWKAIEKTRKFEGIEGKTCGSTEFNEWFVYGLVIGHCLLRRYSICVNQPRHFFKVLLNGVDSVDMTLRDMAYVNTTTAQSYANMYFACDKDLQSLGVEFDESYTNAFGQVTRGTIDVFVKSELRRSLLSPYCKSCLYWAWRGFSTTLPISTPTTDKLWNYFGRKRVPTAETIINNIYVGKKDVSNKTHDRSCLHKEHILMDPYTRVCPLSMLAQYIRRASEQTLEKFLQFSTGCSVFSGNDWQDKIKISVVRNDSGKRLPEARTCAKQLTLFDYDVQELYSMEQFYSEFEEMMNLVLYDTASFGFV
jgi:hypothetical protein